MLLSVVHANEPVVQPKPSAELQSVITIANLTGVELTDIELLSEAFPITAAVLAPNAEATKIVKAQGNCGFVLTFQHGKFKPGIHAFVLVREDTAYRVRVEINPDFTIKIRTTPDAILNRTADNR